MAHVVEKIKVNGVYCNIQDAKATAMLSVLTGDDTTEGSIAYQIRSAISNIKSNTFKVVDVLPQASKAENGIIYLVPNNAVSGSYVEWIKVTVGSESIMEKIGTTALDLEGFETREDTTELARAIILASGFVETIDTEERTGFNYITLHTNGLATVGIDIQEDGDVAYCRQDVTSSKDFTELKQKVTSLEDTVGHKATEEVDATGVFKYIIDVIKDLDKQSATGSKISLDIADSTLVIDDISVLVPSTSMIKSDTSWFDETKTAYTFSTPQQLKGLSDLVNKGTSDFSGVTITLDSDIDLGNVEWTPIGTASSYNTTKSLYNQTADDLGGTLFKGTFDGNGHVISNLRVTNNTSESMAVGLFGLVRSGSVIKNLTLNNIVVETPESRMVGTVVGYVPRETVDQGTFEIDNVHVTGSIRVSGSYGVGTIIGQTEAGMTNLHMHNCSVVATEGSYVQATIIGKVFAGVGGLVGCVYGQTDNIIEDNTVSGLTVYSAGEGVGGLIGHFEQGTIQNNTIKNTTVINKFDTTLSMLEAVAVGILCGNFDSTFTSTSTKSVVIVNENTAENDNVLIPEGYNGASIGTTVDSDGYPSWKTWPVIGCFRKLETVDPSEYVSGTCNWTEMKAGITLARS